MQLDQFTQNSMKAIQDCEKLAYEYGNQEMEQEHLLVALLRQEDSLIKKLIERMEINVEHFVSKAEEALSKRVKVQGGQLLVGDYLNKTLITAEDEAKKMGDSYVSVEHLFLSMLKHPSKTMKAIFFMFFRSLKRFINSV